MNRINKAKKIGKILDKLYPETPVPLNHSDEYTLLVAVMLSAQTTDKKVNEVSPKLFRKAGNPIAMIKLGEQKIKEIIKTFKKIIPEFYHVEKKYNLDQKM